jgi:hypothetical protein
MGASPFSEDDGGATVTLAAVLIMAAGAVDVTVGIVAKTHAHSWGWAFVAYGVAQALAGIMVLVGSRGARLAAIVLSTVSAIAHVTHIPDRPAWAIGLIAVDAVIVFVLVVNGARYVDERRMVDLLASEADEGWGSADYVSDPDAGRAAAMIATGRPVS